MIKENLKTIIQGVEKGSNPNDLAQQMYDLSDEIIMDYDLGNSYRLLKHINKLLVQKKKTMSASAIAKLDQISTKLQYMALPILKESILLDLVEKKLTIYLGDEHINVYEKIRSSIINLPVYDRDAFKHKILIRLNKNKELISNIKLTIDDEEVNATVANIIRDFLHNSKRRQDSSLQVASYIQGTHFRNLNEEEKIKVQELLKLFILINSVSASVEGLEEAVGFIEDGVMKILDKGVITILSPDKRSLPSSIGFLGEPEQASAQPSVPAGESDIEKEVLAAYQGDKKLQKAIAREIKKLDKKFGSDTEGLRTEFFQTTQKGNINRTVGALMLMTQNDDLLEFISEDPKLNKFLSAIWEKQYGADLVADFKINPTDVKYVKMFLQYVLEQRLHIDEDDAARVGLQIGNAFAGLGKKSYNKMAYFDVKSKQFRWFE